jgi:HAD superfamily hydrolase (TIGR01450 family)
MLQARNQSAHRLPVVREIADPHLEVVSSQVVARALADHQRDVAEARVVVANKIWNQYDLLLADLDGVIYEGQAAIVNAVSTIDTLHKQLIAVGYVTNNSSRKPEAIADQLVGFGVNAQAIEVISSGLTAVELLSSKVPQGSKVYVVGGDGLRNFVIAGGFQLVNSSEENPAAVLQGFAPDVSWRELAEASYSIANGAIWIATNNDWTLPQEKGIAPGNGTLVSAVHTAVGQLPLIAGKPEPAIYKTALKRFEKESALFVGDRLETDILGANRASFDSAVVMTGIASRKDVLGAQVEERPKYILETLADLLHDYLAPVQTKRGWRCGEVSVELLGDKVMVVEGNPRSIEALRAATQVIWNSGKHIHFLDVQSALYETKA